MTKSGAARFSTRQTARLFLIPMTAAVLLCALLLGRGISPLASIWLLLALFVLIGCALLFYSLTVEVTDRDIRIRFGIGVVERRFPLADIQAVKPVRNRWYYGWGMRLTPHGWLYNVEGLDAVELAMSTWRHVRIGTDKPVRLTKAIRAAIREDDNQATWDNTQHPK